MICNADPKRMLAMLDGSEALPDDYRERLRHWDVDSPVVKLNVALNRMPAFSAAESIGIEPQRAQVTITPGLDAAQAAVESCPRGEPAFGFAELYFQSTHDASVVPPGREVMSVFAQFAPYELADGDWDSRREEIGARLLDEIAAYASRGRRCPGRCGIVGWRR